MVDDTQNDFQLPSNISANEDDYDDVHFQDNQTEDHDNVPIPDIPLSPQKDTRVKFASSKVESSHQSESRTSRSKRNPNNNNYYNDNNGSDMNNMFNSELPGNVKRVMDIYQIYQAQKYQKEIQRSQQSLAEQQKKISKLLKNQKFIDNAVKANIMQENNIDDYLKQGGMDGIKIIQYQILLNF